jgi:hypothetical protein
VNRLRSKLNQLDFFDPKAAFEPQRNCLLQFLQQSLRGQREPVLMTHNGPSIVRPQMARAQLFSSSLHLLPH